LPSAGVSMADPRDPTRCVVDSRDQGHAERGRGRGVPRGTRGARHRGA
jgi:hypothetical protein